MASPVCKKINKRMAFILKEYEAGTGITEEMKAYQLCFITSYFHLKTLNELKQKFPRNAAEYDRREETLIHLEECTSMAMALLTEVGWQNPYKTRRKKTQEDPNGGVTANWGEAGDGTSGRSSPFTITSSVMSCSSHETELTGRRGSQDLSELDEFESDDERVPSIATMDLLSDEDTPTNVQVNRDGFSQTDICVNHDGSCQTDVNVSHDGHSQADVNANHDGSCRTNTCDLQNGFCQTETCVNQDNFCQTKVESEDKSFQADFLGRRKFYTPRKITVLKDTKTVETETEDVSTICKYCKNIVSFDEMIVPEVVQRSNASKASLNKSVSLESAVASIIGPGSLDFGDAINEFIDQWKKGKLKNKTLSKPQLEKRSSASLKVPSETNNTKEHSISPLRSPALRNSESYSIDSDASAGEKCVPTSSKMTSPANPQKRKCPESAETWKTAAKRNKTKANTASNADQLPTRPPFMTLAQAEKAVPEIVKTMAQQCAQEQIRYVAEMNQAYPQNTVMKNFLQIRKFPENGSTTPQNDSLLEANKEHVTSTQQPTATNIPPNIAPVTDIDETSTAAVVSQNSKTSTPRSFSDTSRRSSITATANYANATTQSNPTVAQQDIIIAAPQNNAPATQNNTTSNTDTSTLQNISNTQHNVTLTPQNTAVALPQYNAMATMLNNQTNMMQNTGTVTAQNSMPAMQQNVMTPDLNTLLLQYMVKNQQIMNSGAVSLNIVNAWRTLTSLHQNTPSAAPQYNATAMQQNDTIPNFDAIMSQNEGNAMRQQHMIFTHLNTATAAPQFDPMAMAQNNQATMQQNAMPPIGMPAIQQGIATTTMPATVPSDIPSSSIGPAVQQAFQSIGLGQEPSQYDFLCKQAHNVPRPPPVSTSSSFPVSVYQSNFGYSRPPRISYPPMNPQPPRFNGPQFPVRPFAQSLNSIPPHLIPYLNGNPNLNQQL